MTMWVFGDSFSRHFKYLPDTWVEKTAQILRQDVVSHSRPVYPLELIFHKFNEERNKIKENDIIIHTLTNIDRRWWFPTQVFKTYMDYNEEETEAENYYKAYLKNFEEIHFVYLTNFLFNLNDFTRRNNTHTIVIANFNDYDEFLPKIQKDLPAIHFGKGSMCLASNYEWKKEIVKYATMEFYVRQDKRLNHFCRRNHHIICDKIVDNIRKKIPIDFTQGMETDFLTEELLEEPDFREYELYKDEWKVAGL